MPIQAYGKCLDHVRRNVDIGVSNSLCLGLPVRPLSGKRHKFAVPKNRHKASKLKIYAPDYNRCDLDRLFADKKAIVYSEGIPMPLFFPLKGTDLFGW